MKLKKAKQKIVLLNVAYGPKKLVVAFKGKITYEQFMEFVKEALESDFAKTGREDEVFMCLSESHRNTLELGWGEIKKFFFIPLPTFGNAWDTFTIICYEAKDIHKAILFSALVAKKHRK